MPFGYLNSPHRRGLVSPCSNPLPQIRDSLFQTLFKFRHTLPVYSTSTSAIELFPCLQQKLWRQHVR
jgi:hypothetical protein